MKLKLLLLCASLMHSLFLFGTVETKKIHEAHFAGRWYPGNREALTKDLAYYFSLADTHFKTTDGDTVNALIVPHAGYYFSGLCAASAYQAIKNASFDRVIIIGPSHTKRFDGIAVPDYEMYRTPMGEIAVDQKAISDLLATSPLCKVFTDAHQKEHSIEVQLPFLQFCLNNFSIVPLAVGNLQEKDFKTVAQAISKLLRDNKKTLIVVSSDLIHYGARFGYTPAFGDVAKFDTMAIKAICDTSYSEFDSIIKKTKATICGKGPIKILLKLIKIGALGQETCQLASYYNSAQMEASRNGKMIDVLKLSQVIPAESSVSYASFVCRSKLTPQEKQTLLQLARDSITKKLFPNEKISDSFTSTDNLKKASGAFVTLKTKAGRLRGCIGRMFSKRPLYETIPEIARSSAFGDPRFSPLKKEELDNIVISITVLTPPHSVNSYNDIIIGKHGIILEKIVNGAKKSAVFLPQVAVEQGWNLAETLTHLSKKAGLEKDAWKNGCQFKVFEGFEFGE
ncbi:AmmeMemoRadiSam system protein B [Candidatus Dependentiae bacterium]